MKKKSKKEKKQYSTPEDSYEMTPEIITTVPQLKNIIKNLPKCHTISSRLTAANNILDLKNKELYQKFIELKGLSILSNWLKEYKKSVVSGNDLLPDEESIIINIINLCKRIHLSINDLKNSKIGKNINSLGKALPDKNHIKKRCEEIIEEWKKMLEDEEEEKEENNEDYENLHINNIVPENNIYSGNSINKTFLNNKTQRNSHNSNPLTNFNPNANNINLNANNASNKINPIKIKSYVINSTNFFFSLISKIIKKMLFFS